MGHHQQYQRRKRGAHVRLVFIARALRAELESFIRAVSDDKEPVVSGEDGLKALAVVQQIVASGEQSKAINL